ncbi:MAG: TraB/GumN family protein [Acetobacteraceae bacterium]|nr:TraB/GumN family protein [Acetobacteraceae bacterium]
MAWLNDLAAIFLVPAGAVALATGIYWLSGSAEKRAKPQALAEISTFLTKRAAPLSSSAVSWTLKLFQLTYGDRQFSKACWESSLIAFLSLRLAVQVFRLAVAALGILEGHVPLADDLDDTAMAVGAVTAYLSVWKTRALLKLLVGSQRAAALGLALVSDFFMAALLGTIAVYIVFLWSTHDFPKPSRIVEMAISVPGDMAIVVMSAIYTSLWVWLTILACVIFRLSGPILKTVLRFLDVESHPLRSIAVVSGIVIFVLSTAAGVISVCMGHPAVGAYGVPAFQVTAPNGRTSTFIGSLNDGDSRLRQPSMSVLDGAHALVVEWQPSDPEPPQPSWMIRSHGSLAQELTAGEVKAFRDRVAACGMSPDSALLLPPAVTAFRLETCDKSFAKSRNNIFNIFWTVAQRSGIQIVSLDTKELFYKEMVAVPDSVYVGNIRRKLATDPSEVRGRLVAAINMGDFDSIQRLSEAQFVSHADAAVFWLHILEERNLAWMPKLEEQLSSGNVVVLVGAGHLSGHGSLLELLREKGYRVQSVMLP